MLIGGLGSSSVVSMGLRIYLKDDVSGPASRVRSTFDDMRGDLNKYKEGLRLAQTTYGAMALAGAGAIRGMANWVKQGAEYAYMIEGVGAVTDATKKEIEEMYNLANRLGKETMFMPEEVASGMRHLGLAGMTAQETMANIQAAVKLAGASLAELGGKGGAADIMINVMMAWRYHFSQAENVADKLAIAANKSNLDLFDLAEGLKYTAATARDLNQPLDVVLSQLMTLANMGIKGSMAGTALENMYRYLSRALGEFRTSRQTRSFEAIGLSAQDFIDAKGNLKPMLDVFTMLSTKVKEIDAGNVKLQAWLEAIFGVRGKRGASAFLRNLDMVKKNFDLVANSSGQAGNIMGQMMATLEGAFKKLRSSWASFKNAFTKALTPVLKPLIMALKGVVDLVTIVAESPIGRILVPLVTGLIVMKTAVWSVKFAVSTLMLTVGRFGAEFAAVSASVSQGWRTMAANALGYNYLVGYGAIPPGYGRTKKGVFYKTTPGKGARFIKGKPPMQPGIKGWLGGMIGGGIGKTAAKGIGGRLLGFLGGWWGVGITAAMLLLPAIIDWLQGTRKNNDAIEANTKALKEKIAQDKAAAVKSEYLSPTEVHARVYDKTLGDIRETYVKLIEALSALGPEAQAWATSKTPIQIYVDAPYYIQTKKEKSDTIRAIINTRP